jgi:hypothetical protein
MATWYYRLFPEKAEVADQKQGAGLRPAPVILLL